MAVVLLGGYVKVVGVQIEAVHVHIDNWTQRSFYGNCFFFSARQKNNLFANIILTI